MSGKTIVILAAVFVAAVAGAWFAGRAAPRPEPAATGPRQAPAPAEQADTGTDAAHAHQPAGATPKPVLDAAAQAEMSALIAERERLTRQLAELASGGDELRAGAVPVQQDLSRLAQQRATIEAEIEERKVAAMQARAALAHVPPGDIDAIKASDLDACAEAPEVADAIDEIAPDMEHLEAAAALAGARNRYAPADPRVKKLEERLAEEERKLRTRQRAAIKKRLKQLKDTHTLALRSAEDDLRQLGKRLAEVNASIAQAESARREIERRLARRIDLDERLRQVSRRIGELRAPLP